MDYIGFWGLGFRGLRFRVIWVVPRIRVPFLVPLNVGCRNVNPNQKGPKILRTAHVWDYYGGY